ncbi:hypothetical protein [Acidithiobacillus ferriphilus]|uniref:hypothetical protein n=1 Tax=Acidithiobacillus ferriphilus TaxID=1689834 RepID=UPI00232DFB83|nr:hypothetical protein [Acidithiobacillus ferriphilus]WCE93268.1 hypothetical protein PJU76_09915 [Acidithiobacillus ferriphilus]
MFLAHWKTVVGMTAMAFTSAALGGTIPPPLNQLLHTSELRAKGFDGQGVRVGVISNGTNNYPALRQANILPGNVQIYSRPTAQGDEGDWMMQIVHNIAPAARLGFCAGGAPEKTNACAHTLITQFHANIIVDDINPQPTSFSPTLKMLGYSTLHKEFPNVLFFTGAGNNNGGYYESSWVPTPLAINRKTYLAQDFGQSSGTSSAPYDRFLLPAHASALVMLGTNALPPFHDRCSSTNPFTRLVLLNTNNRILASVSSRCPELHAHFQNSRDTPRVLRIAVLLNRKPQIEQFALKLVAIFQGEGVSPLDLQYHTSGSAGNSATAPGLVAVAAVDPGSDYHNEFIDEPFANQGPQYMDYEADPSSATGWTRLSQEERFQQPLLAAPDRTIVAFPAQNAQGYVMRPFLGDSAAGPAAAGVAALLLSAHVPTTDILRYLEQGAIKQGQPGWSPRFGYGVVNADAAAAIAGIVPAPAIQQKHNGDRLVIFHPSRTFVQDHRWMIAALHGNTEDLNNLRRAAGKGHVNAETWMAFYEHATGNNIASTHWAWLASQAGQPVAESFLGTLFNRGWGVLLDPRAAHAWWLRSAQAGVPDALYNLGTTTSAGRGSVSNPVIGYALMQAAMIRGLRFPPMMQNMARVRGHLTPQEYQRAEHVAQGFASDPNSIPTPWSDTKD